MIEIVRGCLAARMTKIAKRRVELSYNITKESARAVQRGGQMDPQREGLGGSALLYVRINGFYLRQKKICFCLKFIIDRFLSNEFTLR